MRVCSSFLAGSGGPAFCEHFGAPHLTFGRFLFLFCSAPSGLGSPLSCRSFCLLAFLSFFFFLSSLFFPLFVRPRCLLQSLAPAPGVPALAPFGPFPRCPPFFFCGSLCCSVCFPPPYFFSVCCPPHSPQVFVLWVSCWPALCHVLLFFLSSAWPSAALPPAVCVSQLLSLPLSAQCFSSTAVLVSACLAFVSGANPFLFPPPFGVRVLPCAVWCHRAVWPFCLVFCGRLVFCGAVLPVPVLWVVLWCRALLCCQLLRAVQCSLGWLSPCWAVLLVAAVCCAVSLVVPSGCGVRVVVCCLFLVRNALCCAVLCPLVRCCALFRPALCCCVLCCLAWFVWCRCLLCHAPRAARRPGVLSFPLFCGVSPRCVLCAVCVLSWCVGACCWSLLCFVLRASWVVVLCVPCPLRSVWCCAALCGEAVPRTYGPWPGGL